MLLYRKEITLIWTVVSALSTLALSSVNYRHASRGMVKKVRSLAPRAIYASNVDDIVYSLSPPMDSLEAAGRQSAILATQASFLYGPDLIAGGTQPYYPTGPLGLATVLDDTKSLANETLAWSDILMERVQSKVVPKIVAEGGLKSLKDYQKFYAPGALDDLIPDAPYPGILENMDDDFLFSSLRLAAQPFSLRRLKPGQDQVPFPVGDDDSRKLSTMTAGELLQANRLFYVDYRAQAELEQYRLPDRYSGASDALFFLSKDGRFLPLAIRPNVLDSSSGKASEVVYTPLDSANEWMLAKMIFHQNDAWFTAFYHLASTHELIEIVYMAAIRSLSKQHPIFGMLDRLLYESFGIRLLFNLRLINPGGFAEAVFTYRGFAGGIETHRAYSKGAGDFRASFLETDMKNRGLLVDDAQKGQIPPLPNFAYYEDASVIRDSVDKVMSTFVNLLYPDDAALQEDREVQAWLREANGLAQVHDFSYDNGFTRQDLSQVLTHVAYVAAVKHNVLNTNVPSAATGVLPLFPTSFRKPLPTQKGHPATEEELVSYLPDLNVSATSVVVWALFSRPYYATDESKAQEAKALMGQNFTITGRTLSSMFQTPVIAQLEVKKEEMKTSRLQFEQEMGELSRVVRSRRLDEGNKAGSQSQGMPFAWKALDPELIPFNAAI